MAFVQQQQQQQQWQLQQWLLPQQQQQQQQQLLVLQPALHALILQLSKFLENVAVESSALTHLQLVLEMVIAQRSNIILNKILYFSIKF